MMETSSLPHTTFPKRIRSVSARLFSMNNVADHKDNKRTSCQLMASSDQQHSILNPSKWFPRIRCRSSSSASSTFSVVFSSSSTLDTSYSSAFDTYEHQLPLEVVSSELEALYKTAKEEIAYAVESQGSIYYEGDKNTAHAAFELCEAKYDTVMQMFGDTTNAIKFRFRWETDLSQLRRLLLSLPTVHHSIYD